MSLAPAVRDSFERSFTLYRDLAATLERPTLESKLPGLPSNTVALQLWCVVGARESYARAIAQDAWPGFACSLQTPEDPVKLNAALRRSEDAVRGVLADLENFSEDRCRRLLDLLEHEAAHQGQLIRYLYGLKLTIPESWKQRYALE